MSRDETLSSPTVETASLLAIPSNVALATLAMLVAAAIGLATVKPIYGALLALALLASAAFPMAIFEPLILTCVLSALTISNLTDILIARYGAPSPSKALVILILISVLLKASRSQAWPQIDRGAAVLFLLSVLSCGLTVFWAEDAEVALNAFTDVLRDVIVAFLLLAVIQKINDLRVISRVVVAALSVIAALGLLNAATGHYERDILGLTMFSIEHISGDVDSYRFSGPLTDPNALARILLIGIPFAFFEMARGSTLAGRFLALICAWILIGGLFLTFSRGGMLALLLMTAVALWRYRNQLLRLSLFAVPCIFLVASFLPATYWSRAEVLLGLASGRSVGAIVPDQSVDNRVDEMHAAALVFTDHPLLGVGVGNFPYLFERYALEHHFRHRFEPRESHSEILRVAAEQGVHGLFVYLLLWGSAIWRCWNTYRQVDSSDLRSADLAFALMLALIGYFSASLFLHEAYARNVWLILGMAFALPQKRAASRGSLERTA